jgi:AdoMet-dependent heme synthase
MFHRFIKGNIMLDVKFKLMPGHTNEGSGNPLSKLKILFWDTTYACNYNCGICFTNSGRASSNELTTGEAKDLFSKAHLAGVEDIVISGGEPFLRKDILDVISHIASQGLTTRIASNGSLLNYNILKRLKDETLTKSFQISIDTLNPDLYGSFHGVSPETLQNTLKVLKDIKALGFHTTVSCRLTPETLPGLPDVLHRACEEGWATVTAHFPLLSGRKGNNFAQDEDFLTLLEPAFEYFLRLPRHWVIEMNIPWAAYHPTSKRMEREIKVNYSGCLAGRDRLSINPRGDISLCVCLDIPDLYMGNIREDDIADVFRNSRLCRMMRHPESHGICADCPHVGICGGGCRVAAYALTGRIDGTDESCPLYKG